MEEMATSCGVMYFTISICEFTEDLVLVFSVEDVR